MIEVQNLTKFYGERKAIDEISFRVEKGEVLGFLGPNGAGKSSTMKILTCFMPASSGKASVAGFDVFEHPLDVKRHVGYLPETPPVYREMIVEDYLSFKASLHGISGSKAKQAVNTALEKCGLTSVRKRLINNLSKGYKQRVGIAQAIVHNPSVLILDEPTVGLDPKQIIEIRDLIKGLAGEHTVILSTHILPEVQATCSRVLIINKGKIVASNTLDEITKQLHKGNIFSVTLKSDSKDFEQKIKSMSVITAIETVQTDEGFRYQFTFNGTPDQRVQIADAAVKSGVGLLEFRHENLTLEQIFIRLISSDKNI